MSLSKEQRQDLERLGKYFRDIEKVALENSIDLDIYMSDYKEEGIEICPTEKLGVKERAGKRKRVFEKSSQNKAGKSVTKR